MEPRFNTVLDQTGTPIASATVTVFESDGVTIATIQTTAGGALANPFTTNDQGEYSYQAANGRYVERANFGGASQDVPVVLFDPDDQPSSNDQQVRVTSNDTTSDFLNSKVAAGTGIVLTVINPAADEDLQIALDSTVYPRVSISSNDTTNDFLLNKLTAGDAITLTEVNDGGDEDLQIAVAATLSNKNIDDATDVSIQSSGILSIGATSPTSKIDVQNISDGSPDGTRGISMRNVAGTRVGMEVGVNNDSYVGTLTNSNFDIRQNNTVRATFDNNGEVEFGPTLVAAQRIQILPGSDARVAIGTDSPTAKLDIRNIPDASPNGTMGVFLRNVAGTAVGMEVGVNNDSYVGTTGNSAFHIRQNNIEKISFNTTGAIDVNVDLQAPDIRQVESIGYNITAQTTPLTSSTLDVDEDLVFLTLSQNQAITTFTTGRPSDSEFLLIVRQNATGGFNVTSWPTAVLWPSNQSAPTIPSGANEFLAIRVYYDGTNFFASPLSLGTASGSGSGSTNKVAMFEDFLASINSVNQTEDLPETFQQVTGTDATASVALQDANTNGIVDIQSGDDAAATMAANGAQITGNRIWRGGDNLVFESRVRIDNITNVAFFVGVTDTNSLEMPFTLGASDVLTSNATDAAGFLFDTAADTDNIWLVGVEGGVDAISQDTTQAYVGGTFITLRIEFGGSSTANFFINGSQVGTQMSDVVNDGVNLTPYVGLFSRNTTSKTAEVDYISCEKDR